MAAEPLHIIVATTMLGIVMMSIAAFHGYLRAQSERRLEAMLSRAGFDPATLSRRRGEAAMKAARRRCRGCACEDLCERWLRGEASGSNDFCPNVKAFGAMQ